MAGSFLIAASIVHTELQDGLTLLGRQKSYITAFLFGAGCSMLHYFVHADYCTCQRPNLGMHKPWRPIIMAQMTLKVSTFAKDIYSKIDT